MAVIERMILKIVGDTSDFQRDLDKAKRASRQAGESMDQSLNKATRATNALNKAMSSLRTLGILGVVTAIPLATKKMLDMTAAIEEMQNKSAVVFGRNLPRVRLEIEKFAEAVGRSRYELEGFAASVQDILVPLGFARDDASKFSLEITKLAVDVASFNNKLDKDVIRDFIAALTGSAETVKKYGIIINENTIANEARRLGLQKSNRELSETEKAQIKFNIILNNTKDAHGDAARTIDGYANQVKRLGGEWEELVVAFADTESAAAGIKLIADGLNTVGNHLERINLLNDGDAGKFNLDTRGGLENQDAYLRELQKTPIRGREVIGGPIAQIYNHLRGGGNADTRRADLQRRRDELLEIRHSRYGYLDAPLRAAGHRSTPFGPREGARSSEERPTLIETKPPHYYNTAGGPNSSLYGEAGSLSSNLFDKNPGGPNSLFYGPPGTDISGANSWQEKMRKNNEELAESFRKVTTSAADTFANNLVEGEKWSSGLKNITKNLVSQMLSELIQLHAIDPIIKGIFGGNAGGGTTGTLISSIGAFFGGGSAVGRADFQGAPITKHARGGILGPGRLGITGDGGRPELISSGTTSAYIHPDIKTALGGGNGTNITNNNNFDLTQGSALDIMSQKKLEGIVRQITLDTIREANLDGVR